LGEVATSVVPFVTFAMVDGNMVLEPVFMMIGVLLAIIGSAGVPILSIVLGFVVLEYVEEVGGRVKHAVWPF